MVDSTNVTDSIKNFESIDNIKQDNEEWVNDQVKAELNVLGENIDSFYSVTGEKVEFKMDVVKQYLSKLYEEVKSMNVSEARQHLVEKVNPAAWIMAVQIALESLGRQEYDVGRIDGIFKKGGTTEAAIVKFQKDNGLTPDGAPGKETLKVLLEKLEEAEVVEYPYRDVKAKGEEIGVPQDREVEAKELVEGVPDEDGITVEFKEGESVDKNKKDESQAVTVVVKKDGEEKKSITVIVKINEEGTKMTVKEKEDIVEEDPFKDIIVIKEVEVPQDREVEAKELVEGVPDEDGVKVEFKDEKGINKESKEEQTVTVVVTVGDKKKEFIIVAKIDGDKIILEYK